MSLGRAAVALAVVLGLVVTPAAALASPQNAVLDKEGYWAIDVDGEACVASLDVGYGSEFLLRGDDGRVTFAVFFAKPIRPGKTGQLRTEAYSFDFVPRFIEGDTIVFFAGYLDDHAVAALRMAKVVRVLVDGRVVNAATFENTGFGRALDALIACSKGEKGWWGAGVDRQADAGPEPEPEPRREPVFNAEGYWALAPSDQPGVCAAAAKVDDHASIILVASGDRIGFGVSSDTEFKRGRRGRLQTDSFGFDFKPAYEGGTYLYAADDLDPQAAFALRRAKAARISIDGRQIVDMTLEGTGHADVLASVVACSRGESGWWGAGAKTQPD